MPATKRNHEPGVMALLLNEPHRFEFAQLLNVLLRALRRQGTPYDKAFGDVLRFRNNLSLAFPPSEVQALEVETNAPPANHGPPRAVAAGALRKIRITPSFVGLLGASGTLPLHDTERVAARRSLDGDTSQHELIDVLSNRMIGLFYEAWGKYRVEHGIDVRGHDRLLPMLMALAGMKSHGAHRWQRACVNDETTGYYAALLRTRPVSAGTIERVLAEHFDLPVRLEQFVGCWDAIPEKRRSTLGTKPVLGFGAALGVRLWRTDLRIRLHIGPLDEEQVQDFLPGGRALLALKEMVCLFAVPALRYEIRLLLAPPCVKRMTLTTRMGQPRRLGWDTFLTGTPGVASRPEIGLMLRLPAPSGRPARPNPVAAATDLVSP
ncbi:type VI secretion system baseplate subunit TssG [Massilia horti]|uniref:Type VI secretion system baseplate subunit TssG n=1 Tax=Massilia horti TaxID=2562153 RepID=A0A4Y9T3N9_9BURK|nr:type VI secretion system baseplate subunit TssG [Massilia horti]TFW34622.1 type VI secretion system baseplate subunit TssG [Massilia horti]